VGDWKLQPVPLVAAAAALALFAQGFVRLRRRGRSSAAQASLFALGVAVSTLAVVSPLDHVADDELLTAHMAQHLLLGDVGPLLLVLAVRGPLVYFLLPPGVLRPLARATWLRRALAVVLRPSVSFGLWAAAVAAWHVPAAYDAAVAHPWLHALEHSCFATAGLLVWIQVLDPARHGAGPGRRAVFAAAVVVAGMALGEVLLLAPPLYPHYAHIASRPFGLTAATDQARAALLMMAEQLATLGTAAAFLLWNHVERVQEEMASEAR
jgi:putative membrane protein